ncbi:MAG: peptidoglycan DD-metalloendopeptidase family protein [Bacteroidaceae bacterium]|nr:peptidoglycan DD-metalloendopeptidase family protein [Bacteroidaceae bacterium]
MSACLLRCVCMLLLVFCTGTVASAQNSKKVNDLKVQKTRLQKNLQKSQQDLAKTGKDVKNGKSYLNYIDRQLDNRKEHIRTMETRIDSVETRMTVLRSDISGKERQLADKKQKYARALRFSRRLPKVGNTLLYVLSAKSLAQMYRRARYTAEYAEYQYDLGQQLIRKQNELRKAQSSLQATKKRMAGMLQEVERQRRKLDDQQARQQQYIKNLQKKESNLRDKVSRQQKELAALNKKIDDLVAYEIEQARKRGAAEAKRQSASQGAGGKGSSATAQKSQPGDSPVKTETPKASSSSWLTAADRKLDGTFAQNRGRLPVPITGQYRIGSRFGTYNVPGLKNVTLDNKGVNYVGKPGARARCVFDGEVSAVFQFAGSKNVLVRHGSYISVYCNLSSVTVSKGQKLKARDIIGTVMSDDSGNCALHFQLRKETTKLNPEAWIGK